MSLVESVMAIVIVSGLLVVALNAAGASRVGQRSLSERGVGQLLAAALMSEILAQPYKDAADTGSNGPESGESNGTRAGFDDVDDYQLWTESPPKNQDGSVIPDRIGWRRSVVVTYVEPDDLTHVRLGDGGAKRITVTVLFNSREAAVFQAIRTGEPEGLIETLPDLF